jgi:Flp pilus assembly protein TadB
MTDYTVWPYQGAMKFPEGYTGRMSPWRRGECMEGKGALILMILGILVIIYGMVTFQWLLMLIIVAVIVVVLLAVWVLGRGRSLPPSPEQARMRNYEESLESIRNSIRKL